MREQVQSQIGVGCIDWRCLQVSDFGADGAYVDTANFICCGVVLVLLEIVNTLAALLFSCSRPAVPENR